MSTYKDKLKEIEVQEKALNEQKNALAKQKTELKLQIEQAEKETKAKIAKATEQWFMDYCDRRNVGLDSDGYGVYFVTHDDLEIRRSLHLDKYFENNNRARLKTLVNEFDYVTKAIIALKSVLQILDDKSPLTIETSKTTKDANYYISSFPYCWNKTRMFFKYNAGNIEVEIVKKTGSLYNRIITLTNGVSIEASPEYNTDELTFRKTVIANCEQLDALVTKVDEALKQINVIKIEEL